jgi:hypothetical protein
MLVQRMAVPRSVGVFESRNGGRFLGNNVRPGMLFAVCRTAGLRVEEIWLDGAVSWVAILCKFSKRKRGVKLTPNGWKGRPRRRRTLGNLVFPPTPPSMGPTRH